ncbi:hypothetical protein HPP92_008182 [Vanilla planifolia]|uniref:Uncharacterized protein n=1 Tax=Vanilla planifolia TaxID=51239 RepID=A0A835RHJ5_VANPL|nr:hypothetical protein HPP92_008182 [Vanilla planifolia]
MIVEVIKRRVAGLHQNTVIGSTDITDTWEPLEEGLLPLETTRHVSMIMITLSAKELEKSSVGYQSPLPEEQVKPYADVEYEENAQQLEVEVVMIMAEEEEEDNKMKDMLKFIGFRGRKRLWWPFSHPREGDNDINAPSSDVVEAVAVGEGQTEEGAVEQD